MFVLTCCHGERAVASTADGTAPVQVAITLAVDSPQFRGEMSSDQLGFGTGAMMYGPGPAAALVGLVAHALISNAAQNAQRTAAQREADRVLEPLRESIDGIESARLVERVAAIASTRGILVGSGDPGGWRVEIAPTLTLTQDRAAWLLDTQAQVKRPGAADDATRIAVRVVSDPYADDDLAAYWNAGSRLEDEIAGLIATALQTILKAVDDETPADGTAQRTIRYTVGRSERIERATVLGEHCGRVLAKTLRGGWLAAPLARRPPAAPGCAAAAGGAPTAMDRAPAQ